MNKQILPAFLILSFAFSGCITLAEKQAMQNDIASLQAQLEISNKRLETSSEEIQSTSKSLKNVAELNDSFQDLREKLAAFESKFEENKHFIESSKSDNERLLQDMDQRLREMEDKLARQPAAKNSPTGKKSPEPSTGTESSAASTKKKAPSTEQEFYDSAIAPLNADGGKPSKPDLENAEKQLKKFQEKYPKSKLMPNVHYWLGEVHYHRGAYKEAIIEFDEVTRKGEGSAKLKSAYLKQAYSFLALKDEKTGRMLLHYITQKFPKTTEAKLAQDKLQTLDGSGG